MKPTRMRVYFSSLFVLLCATGCNRGGSAVHPPQLDPAKFGHDAVEQYDLNSDGVLAGDELAVAASLKSVISQLDADQDSQLTADEIAAYVQSWQDADVGLTGVHCRVTLKGQPLAGATVTFQPERFQGEAISAAVGISDERGIVRLALEGGQERGLPDGMQVGFYRVRISKIENGKEVIPSKYNEDTTLGQVITSVGRLDSIEFHLR